MISLVDETQITPNPIAEELVPTLSQEGVRLLVAAGRPGHSSNGQIVKQCIDLCRVGVLIADKA